VEDEMEDVFVTKIVVYNVRHLRDLTIELSETTRKHLILTGRNGSGKTSLLEVIKDYFLYPFLSHDKDNFFFLSTPNNDIPYSETVLTRNQTDVTSETIKKS
jgi:recombinational DNA repair ATPase RecF